jgi:hypothetical protein
VIQVLKRAEPTRPFDDAARAEFRAEAESTPVRGDEVNRCLTRLRETAKIEKRYP